MNKKNTNIKNDNLNIKISHIIVGGDQKNFN